MSDIKSEGKRHRIFYYLKFYNNFSMLKLWGQYWWPLTVQTICWLSTTVAIVTTMICFLSWPNYTVGHAYNLNWVWQFVNCEQWTNHDHAEFSNWALLQVWIQGGWWAVHLPLTPQLHSTPWKQFKVVISTTLHGDIP